jgi:hypothetical protein
MARHPTSALPALGPIIASTAFLTAPSLPVLAAPTFPLRPEAAFDKGRRPPQNAVRRESSVEIVADHGVTDVACNRTRNFERYVGIFEETRDGRVPKVIRPEVELRGIENRIERFEVAALRLIRVVGIRRFVERNQKVLWR